jgi:hypothetical protein
MEVTELKCNTTLRDKFERPVIPTANDAVHLIPMNIFRISENLNCDTSAALQVCASVKKAFHQ